MKLEKQVANKGLSEKISQLQTVSPQSQWYWCEYTCFSEGEKVTDWILKSRKEALDWAGITIRAYSVSELGEMLPLFTEGELITQIPYKTLGGRWRVDLDDEGTLCVEDTEANARAKMLVYLLENDLV